MAIWHTKYTQYNAKYTSETCAKSNDCKMFGWSADRWVMLGLKAFCGAPR